MYHAPCRPGSGTYSWALGIPVRPWVSIRSPCWIFVTPSWTWRTYDACSRTAKSRWRKTSRTTVWSARSDSTWGPSPMSPLLSSPMRFPLPDRTRRIFRSRTLCPSRLRRSRPSRRACRTALRWWLVPPVRAKQTSPSRSSPICTTTTPRRRRCSLRTRTRPSTICLRSSSVWTWTSVTCCGWVTVKNSWSRRRTFPSLDV
mmetsp:Transcript_6368/g.18037  ORF Transcript_6368/g.18037 Transcript_6368/m.18037 type:complete len:201 (+) Transcript_6368:746-1348(+)